MSLRGKLCLIALVVAGALAVLAGYFWSSVERYDARLAEAREIARLSERIVHLDEVLAHSARMAVLTGEERWLRRYVEKLDSRDTVVARLKNLAPADRDTAARFASEAEPLHADILQREARAFQAVRNGDLAGARDIVISAQHNELRAELRTAITTFRDDMRAVLDRRVQATRAAAEEAMMAAAGIAAGGTGLVVLLAVWVYHGVVRPARNMMAALDDIDAGDTARAIGDTHRGDEMGRLARHLARFHQRASRAATAEVALTDHVMPSLVLDTHSRVVAANDAMAALIDDVGADLASAIPGFAARPLIGRGLGSFVDDGASWQRFCRELRSPRWARLDVGGYSFEIAAVPLYGATQNRLGTLLVWQERSAEVGLAEAISATMAAAGEGDLSTRVAGRAPADTGPLAPVASELDAMLAELESRVGAVTAAMTSAAEGDLTRTLDQQSRGTLAELEAGWNNTLAGLAQRVQGLVTSARALAAAAQAPAGDAAPGDSDRLDALAQRVRRLRDTVAAMQDAAAAMEQSARTVADLRARADTAAAGADASEAGEAAETLRAQVAEIEAVAFQANLAALNTGAEAARAGEAGARGLESVSAEMRSLADRAGVAAEALGRIAGNLPAGAAPGPGLTHADREALATSERAIGTAARRLAAAVEGDDGAMAPRAEIDAALADIEAVRQAGDGAVPDGQAVADAAASLTAAAETLHLPDARAGGATD